MKKKLVALFAIGAFFAASAQASWMIVNEDGSMKKLENCCKKKVYKKRVKAPEVCETCDYSKFPLATLLPVGDEKLQPATLKNCGD